MAADPLTCDHPFIHLRLKPLGQVVLLDRIELSLLGNDNGDEAEVWRQACGLLVQATNQAIATWEAKRKEGGKGKR